MVLIKHRHPEEPDKGMTSTSLKDVSSSGVLMVTMRIESRPCSKSFTAWSKKEYSSQPGSSGKWVSVDTLPVKPGLMCDHVMNCSGDQV